MKAFSTRLWPRGVTVRSKIKKMRSKIKKMSRKWSKRHKITLFFDFKFQNALHEHLRAVFTQYSHISQTDIRRVVASEFSGDIADLHLGLVDCSQNIPGFQADVRSE